MGLNFEMLICFLEKKKKKKSWDSELGTLWAEMTFPAVFGRQTRQASHSFVGANLTFLAHHFF